MSSNKNPAANKKRSSLVNANLGWIEAALFSAAMILAGATFAAMAGLPVIGGLCLGALAGVSLTTNAPAAIKEKLSGLAKKFKGEKKPKAVPAAAPATTAPKNRLGLNIRKLFNFGAKPAAAVQHAPVAEKHAPVAEQPVSVSPQPAPAPAPTPTPAPETATKPLQPAAP